MTLPTEIRQMIFKMIFESTEFTFTARKGLYESNTVDEQQPEQQSNQTNRLAVVRVCKRFYAEGNYLWPGLIILDFPNARSLMDTLVIRAGEEKTSLVRRAIIHCPLLFLDLPKLDAEAQYDPQDPTATSSVLNLVDALLLVPGLQLDILTLDSRTHACCRTHRHVRHGHSCAGRQLTEIMQRPMGWTAFEIIWSTSPIRAYGSEDKYKLLVQRRGVIEWQEMLRESTFQPPGIADPTASIKMFRAARPFHINGSFESKTPEAFEPAMTDIMFDLEVPTNDYRREQQKELRLVVQRGFQYRFDFSTSHKLSGPTVGICNDILETELEGFDWNDIRRAEEKYAEAYKAGRIDSQGRMVKDSQHHHWVIGLMD